MQNFGAFSCQRCRQHHDDDDDNDVNDNDNDDDDNDASVSTTTDDPSAKTLSVLKTFLNRKFEEEMSYKTIFDFCISDF